MLLLLATKKTRVPPRLRRGSPLFLRSYRKQNLLNDYFLDSWFIVKINNNMIDIEKQIRYWSDGADEELNVALTLLGVNKIRHSLFFAHLALEKIFKALVCRKTGNIAPRMHNLIRLVEISGVELSEDKVDFLIEMNIYNLEGRYPGSNVPLPDYETAADIIKKTEEMIRWLKSLLNL